MSKQLKSTFLDATRGTNTGHIPVWFMRQAGRALPEYRTVREKYDFLTVCNTPELATEVTLQPVDILGVDAAILFADIMLPLIPMGVNLNIKEGVGPVIENPIVKPGDVKNIETITSNEHFDYQTKAVRLIKNKLGENTPLIGFAGAPFTLASYIIEGKPSKNYALTKSFMITYEKEWHELMQKLTDTTIVYLKNQIAAGADAIQLFDSWAGVLTKSDYVTYALPYSKKIFEALGDSNVPRIHFGLNTTAFLEDFASVPAEVLGVDWHITLTEVNKRVKNIHALQGNLDSALLLGDIEVLKKRVDEILKTVPNRAAYIFNTGSGIVPNTPVDTLKQLVEYIHSK